jgi:hypothetical protein
MRRGLDTAPLDMKRSSRLRPRSAAQPGQTPHNVVLNDKDDRRQCTPSRFTDSCPKAQDGPSCPAVQPEIGSVSVDYESGGLRIPSMRV